jgi:hypothetical protein
LEVPKLVLILYYPLAFNTGWMEVVLSKNNLHLLGIKINSIDLLFKYTFIHLFLILQV